MTDPVLLAKIAAITKPIITREARPTTCPAPEKQPASVYIQEDGRIDYARLLRDEVFCQFLFDNIPEYLFIYRI